MRGPIKSLDAGARAGTQAVEETPARARETTATFAGFELDLEHGLLVRGGRRVPLRNQSSRVLCQLVARRGALVSREEIRRSLWGEGTFICFEQGVADCVREIRAALGDSARRPRFVETVPRRGYRFVALVQPAEATAGSGEGRKRAASATGPFPPRLLPKWGRGLLLVAMTLGTALDRGESGRGAPRPAPPEVQERLVAARTSWARRRPEDLRRARDLAREAAALAPQHAPAHALLSLVESTLADHAGRNRHLFLERALAAADRALENDSDLAAAHAAHGLAGLLGAGGWRWAATERSLRRAIRLNPSEARARLWLSSLLRFTGRLHEAVDEARSAVDLDPLDPAIGMGLANALYYAGDAAGSEAACERVLSVDPRFYKAHFARARAALRRGRRTEAALAVEVFQQGAARDPYFAGGVVDLLHRLGRRVEAAELLAGLASQAEFPYERAVGEMAFGHRSEALRALEQAHAQGDPCLRLIGIDERLEPLREEARFERILAGMGLAPPSRSVARPGSSAGS